MKRKNKLKILENILLLINVLFFAPRVYAASDPIEVVNNLSDFIFKVIQGIGFIILGFSVVQFGLAMKSHDPSQKSNSIIGFAGGLFIVFAKEIIDRILG